MVYECENCKKPLPPNVTACPACGLQFTDAVPADAEVASTGFRAVSPPASQPTITSQSQVARKPGVQFKPCTAEQIKRRAESGVRKDLKENTGIASLSSFSAIGWMPVVGVVACFFGPVGIIVGIILILLSVAAFVFGIGAGLWGYVGTLDAQKVAGEMHRWRNMCEGKCPVCKTDVSISPSKEVTQFRCPKCRVGLDFDRGFVSPMS